MKLLETTDFHGYLMIINPNEISAIIRVSATENQIILKNEFKKSTKESIQSLNEKLKSL